MDTFKWLKLNGTITIFGGSKPALMKRLEEAGLDYNYCQMSRSVWQFDLKK